MFSVGSHFQSGGVSSAMASGRSVFFSSSSGPRPTDDHSATQVRGQLGPQVVFCTFKTMEIDAAVGIQTQKCKVRRACVELEPISKAPNLFLSALLYVLATSGVFNAVFC